MTDPDRRAGQGSPTVSPLTIPLLLLGLMIGFFAGYFFLWWGLIAVIAVVLAAFSMVLAGRSKDGATGAVLGVVAGYGLVILVAMFRGAL
jgi:hypothetical protein